MFEKIIDSYSTDSVEIIKEEYTDFLLKIGERHYSIHEEEIESSEEYKKIIGEWDKLFDMAKEGHDLNGAIFDLQCFITSQSTATHDLFYQRGIADYFAKKELEPNIPEMIELYRSGVHKRYRPKSKNYTEMFEDFKKSRQYIIDELGEPAANIIDGLDRLETEAEETTSIILYIGAYHDAKLIDELMRARGMD